MKYFDDLSTITIDCVNYEHNATLERFQQYQDGVSVMLDMAKLVDCKITYKFHCLESYEITQYGSHVMTYYSFNEVGAFLHGMLTMQTRKVNEESQ